MARVLVVEDSQTQAVLIRFLLQKAGIPAGVASNGVEALRVMESARPDLVLTDLQMPEMNGLELVQAVRTRFPNVPVVLMTGGGSEELAMQALQAGAVHYTSKQHAATDLVDLVRRLLPAAPSQADDARFWQSVTHSDLRLALENDPALIPGLVARVRDDLSRMQLCDETAQFRVGVALGEAVANAMFHGNLAVGAMPRDGDAAAFGQLCNQRRSDPACRDRRVDVRITLTPSEAVFVIRDEGAGFDSSQAGNPQDATHLGPQGRRGIFLMRSFMDEVRFNDAGNEVTLRKRRDASANPAQPG